jgi:hypothetical protein
MPWQAAVMGTRAVVVALLLALGPMLAACTGDDSGAEPGQDKTSDADCADRIPDHVFTVLAWTVTSKPAEATVRGCHREAEEGYVEVRERTGYDKLCATLDRTGGVGPGTPVDWLDGTVTACAVEPAQDVGQTKVVVKGSGDQATQITIAVLTSTPQAKVREAVAELVGTS